MCIDDLTINSTVFRNSTSTNLDMGTSIHLNMVRPFDFTVFMTNVTVMWHENNITHEAYLQYLAKPESYFKNKAYISLDSGQIFSQNSTFANWYTGINGGVIFATEDSVSILFQFNIHQMLTYILYRNMKISVLLLSTMQQ